MTLRLIERLQEGIGGALGTDGGGGAVAREDERFAGKRNKPLQDAPDKGVVVAALEVGPPDAPRKERVARQENPSFLEVVASTALGMTRRGDDPETEFFSDKDFHSVGGIQGGEGNVDLHLDDLAEHLVERQHLFVGRAQVNGDVIQTVHIIDTADMVGVAVCQQDGLRGEPFPGDESGESGLLVIALAARIENGAPLVVVPKEHAGGRVHIKMEDLVNLLTDEELAYLSFGKSGYVRSGTGIIGGQFNSGLTKKYNIPYGDTCDGPAGLRQSEEKMGSTAWPCSTALASSFDVDLLKKVGEETGKEARKIGCVFWLAPGMNIHRSPLCGRNFEYYSEDPLLSGKLASAITQGVQSKRVSITLKHFAVNNKEYNRNGDNDEDHLASDSRMAERVAREIYLKGFEIAVKEGKPWAIMSSYNRINSVKTSSSYDLLTNILRGEWNFDGFVMTDWYTNSHIEDEAHAGSSVKMPAGSVADMLEGMEKGIVTRDDLKRNVLYLLNTLPKTFCIDAFFKEPENKIKITDEQIKIKVFDNIYRKNDAIWYEECKDEDKGFNPTNTWTGNWISIYIDNENDGYRLIRVRYSSIGDGFGVGFMKYDENLGEITDLEKTGDWQKWKTSDTVSVRMPKGSYEFTIKILGGEGANLGNINYIEIM